MRLKNYLTELASNYSKGITMVDIDETLFNTFAKIKVIKNGKVIKELDNQEFNTYELKPNESFNFDEFRSAEIFNKTSIPIPQTVNRIKRMIKNIKDRGSKIVFLTARADFDDKEVFLNTFRKHGIPIDQIYVERSGNDITGTVSQRKKKIVLRYLLSGMYRRCRLIDDDLKNLKDFLSIENELPQNIINKIKEIHHISDDETIPVIEFFALLVKKDGSLKRIK